jgi:hypothetical protein
MAAVGPDRRLHARPFTSIHQEDTGDPEVAQKFGMVEEPEYWEEAEEDDGDGVDPQASG